MSQDKSRQSFIVGALSGALILSVGAAAFFYTQANNNNDLSVTENIVNVDATVLAPPSDSSALFDLFGASDPNGKLVNVLKFDGDESNTLTSIWFNKEVKIGDDDIYVKFYKTQQLDASGNPVDSHATQVLVSAITYKKAIGKWQVLSKQNNIGSAGSWGDVTSANVETLELTSNTPVLMIGHGEGGQGQFFEYKQLLAYSGSAWKDIGVVLMAGENSGDCDESPQPNTDFSLGPCWKYESTISVVKESKSEFPDLLVSRTGTQSKEHRISVEPAKNVIYVFDGFKYTNPEINF